MRNSTTHSRHGLYIPIELLDQIRVLAQTEKMSINKQIERIIRDWLETHKVEGKISRQALLNFPIERRRTILESQAKVLNEYYRNSCDFTGGEGDFFEYE